MSNSAVRFSFVLILFSFCLFVAFTQKKTSNYANLLTHYQEAHHYYDQATSLSDAKNYGPREEALEAELNKKALSAFSSLHEQIPRGFSLFDSITFYTIFRIGELQHYFEDFRQAVCYYNKAIEIKE